jgi:prophage tail gpP-like protein
LLVIAKLSSISGRIGCHPSVVTLEKGGYDMERKKKETKKKRKRKRKRQSKIAKKKKIKRKKKTTK